MKKVQNLETTGNFQKKKFSLIFIIFEHLIFFLKKKKKRERERERKKKGTVDNWKEAFCNVWQLDSPGVAGHGISVINTNAFKDFYILFGSNHVIMFDMWWEEYKKFVDLNVSYSLIYKIDKKVSNQDLTGLNKFDCKKFKRRSFSEFKLLL